MREVYLLVLVLAKTSPLRINNFGTSNPDKTIIPHKVKTLGEVNCHDCPVKGIQESRMKLFCSLQLPL